MYPYHASVLKGFGKSFKQQVRLGGFTKVLARPENRVVVDPNRKDAYGIPILVAHFRWGDNDRRVYRDMMKTAFEILDAAGAASLCLLPRKGFPSPAGLPRTRSRTYSHSIAVSSRRTRRRIQC